MTEKLGVLLLELPNSWHKYNLLRKIVFPVGKTTIWETDDKKDIVIDEAGHKAVADFPKIGLVRKTLRKTFGRKK